MLEIGDESKGFSRKESFMLVAIKFPANDEEQIIEQLLKQFGRKTSILKVAQYAEDEFYIPFDKAVKIIHESTTSI
jgi:hypothetical protein